MKLGFVSAILPDLTFAEVVQFAAREGFACVEGMCWPKGKAERRYAGITHLDVAPFSKVDADATLEALRAAKVEISGLGYYPNPLAPDPEEGRIYVEHIKKVIHAASLLRVGVVNTFIGRDWTRSVDDNWPRFLKVWKPLVKYAEDQGIKIGIENCPMFFSHDEWPGGKNLAHCPAIWRRMFEEIPSPNFGLNFDPSHLIWQQIDCAKALREFGSRIFHVHAKDARVDYDRMYEYGILTTPLRYHTPKLPGLGHVNWPQFFSVLTEIGYQGPVCIEVEDRAYEGSLENRQRALTQSRRFLTQFC